MPFIPDHIRNKHIYIPGIPGQGKSTAMLAQAKQDIDAGRGVTFIDPSGDAVKTLIHWIPEDRAFSTIWFSVRDKIPLDFMSYAEDDPIQMERVVGDLIYIVEKDPANTPRMVPMLRDVIYTFIELPDRTFLDIYRFFTDPVRQKEILKGTTEKMRRRWQKMPSDKDLDPLLSRMEIYERVPSLNAIFGTPYPKLNIPEVMRKSQVLLVDLDDSEAGRLLGQLLVAQFKRAAFARRDLPEYEVRTPYCLYCDEFQEFQIPDFEKIITQGRKYNIWLTLANQGLYQLDPMIKQAVLRTGTQIIFNLPPEDARAFQHRTPRGLSIASLDPYEALYCIGSGSATLSPIPPPPPPPRANSPAERIRQNTRSNYTPAPYARSGTIRTVDSAPSQEDEEVVGLGEDVSQSDHIEPTKDSTKPVPSHRDKDRGSKKPR